MKYPAYVLIGAALLTGCQSNQTPPKLTGGETVSGKLHHSETTSDGRSVNFTVQPWTVPVTMNLHAGTTLLKTVSVGSDGQFEFTLPTSVPQAETRPFTVDDFKPLFDAAQCRIITPLTVTGLSSAARYVPLTMTVPLNTSGEVHQGLITNRSRETVMGVQALVSGYYTWLNTDQTVRITGESVCLRPRSGTALAREEHNKVDVTLKQGWNAIQTAKGFSVPDNITETGVTKHVTAVSNSPLKGVWATEEGR